MAVRRIAGAALAALLLCGCSNPFLLEDVPTDGVSETGSAGIAASEEGSAVLDIDSVPPEEQDDAAAEQPEQSLPLKGYVICLDPGHGETSEYREEAVSPLSEEAKPAYVSGAEGVNQTEEELNLAVAELVKERLEQRGATVLMTRTTHQAAVSNIERAEIANEANADLCIRIHADGAEDSSAHGVSTLVPAGDLLGTPEIVAPSREAAEYIQAALVQETGASDRGLVERTDLTGFNWSEVPVVLVEMGFLSNPEEDARMETQSYRNKLAKGMAEGAENWLLSQKT